MLDFEKGDPARVQGRAVVYTRVPYRSQPIYLAITSLSPKRIHFSEIGIQCNQQDYDRALHQSRRRHRGKGIVVAFPYSVDDRDLTVYSGDVIRGPEFQHEREARQMVDLLGDAYLTLYSDQRRQPDWRGLPYSALSGERRISSIDLLTDGLLNAIRRGKERFIADRAQRFLDFAMGSPIATDVSEFITFAKRGDSAEILQRYVEKMRAVSGEQYETAARLRDELLQFHAMRPDE